MFIMLKCQTSKFSPPIFLSIFSCLFTFFSSFVVLNLSHHLQSWKMYNSVSMRNAYVFLCGGNVIYFCTFYVRNDNIAEKYTFVEYDTSYMQSISLAVL